MRSVVPLFLLAFAASAPALAYENVPVTAFHSIQLRGGGEVIVRPGPAQQVTIVEGSSQFTRIYTVRNGELRIDACNNRCPQHYRLRVEIRSPRMPNVAIMGGGKIAATPGFGRAGDLDAAVDGGGLIDLRAVEAEDVSAAVNGGGRISVRPRSSLTAAVNGGGEVVYAGHPQVTMAVHGGGAVRPGY